MLPEGRINAIYFKKCRQDNRRVQLIASMPCYLEENVCAQRGEGVYEKSMEALRMLNGLGHGVASGLSLNLVYNPGGPFLPPVTSLLEEEYRRQLHERFGIAFNRLITIANMPVGRFRQELIRSRQDGKYREFLKES